MKTNYPFIPAEKLKSRFQVTGHFYFLRIPESDSVKCRDILEIRSTGLDQDELADAVFVMMNPGSSRPVNDNDQIYIHDAASSPAPDLVPTVPDTTQYQLMRVMHYMDWNAVRVINLSDLINSKSRCFVKMFNNLEAKFGISLHSIFSEERSNQLRSFLRRKQGAPIVCAWGVSDALSLLTSRAVAALAPDSDVIGLSKNGHRTKYFHPLPTTQTRKEEWVTDMMSLLKSRGTKVA